MHGIIGRHRVSWVFVNATNMLWEASRGRSEQFPFLIEMFLFQKTHIDKRMAGICFSTVLKLNFLTGNISTFSAWIGISKLDVSHMKWKFIHLFPDIEMYVCMCVLARMDGSRWKHVCCCCCCCYHKSTRRSVSCLLGFRNPFWCQKHPGVATFFFPFLGIFFCFSVGGSFIIIEAHIAIGAVRNRTYSSLPAMW